MGSLGLTNAVCASVLRLTGGLTMMTVVVYYYRTTPSQSPPLSVSSPHSYAVVFQTTTAPAQKSPWSPLPSEPASVYVRATDVLAPAAAAWSKLNLKTGPSGIGVTATLLDVL